MLSGEIAPKNNHYYYYYSNNTLNLQNIVNRSVLGILVYYVKIIDICLLFA